MTPSEFRTAREHLCLSQADLAAVWDWPAGDRTIRNWEAGRVRIHPCAVYAIKMMMEKEQ